MRLSTGAVSHAIGIGVGGLSFPRGGPRGHANDGRLQLSRNLHSELRRRGECSPRGHFSDFFKAPRILIGHPPPSLCCTQACSFLLSSSRPFVEAVRRHCFTTNNNSSLIKSDASQPSDFSRRVVGWSGQLMSSRLADLSQANDASHISPPPLDPPHTQIRKNASSIQ